MPVYQPGGTSFGHVYTPSGGSANFTVQNPGTITYVPYAYTYFVRFLKMELYEKPELDRCVAAQKDKKEKDFSSALVWSAETVSAGESSDLRWVMDYMLVGTFQYFGLDSGQRRTVLFRFSDKRIRALRETIDGGSGR